MLVRVHKNPAEILVKYYGHFSSRLKIEKLSFIPDPKIPCQPPSDWPSEANFQAFDLLAHISTRGDVTGQFGAWLGTPGSNLCIEGFSINLGKRFYRSNLSYQAVLGHDWVSPWYNCDEFCGSRGFGLPLLGFRLRLRGNMPQNVRVSYSGSFIGGFSVGPLSEGEFCKSDKMVPLEAIKIDIT